MFPGSGYAARRLEKDLERLRDLSPTPPRNELRDKAKAIRSVKQRIVSSVKDFVQVCSTPWIICKFSENYWLNLHIFSFKAIFQLHEEGLQPNKDSTSPLQQMKKQRKEKLDRDFFWSSLYGSIKGIWICCAIQHCDRDLHHLPFPHLRVDFIFSEGGRRARAPAPLCRFHHCIAEVLHGRDWQKPQQILRGYPKVPLHTQKRVKQLTMATLNTNLSILIQFVNSAFQQRQWDSPRLACKYPQCFAACKVFEFEANSPEANSGKYKGLPMDVVDANRHIHVQEGFHLITSTNSDTRIQKLANYLRGIWHFSDPESPRSALALRKLFALQAVGEPPQWNVPILPLRHFGWSVWLNLWAETLLTGSVLKRWKTGDPLWSREERDLRMLNYLLRLAKTCCLIELFSTRLKASPSDVLRGLATPARHNLSGGCSELPWLGIGKGTNQWTPKRNDHSNAIIENGTASKVVHAANTCDQHGPNHIPLPVHSSQRQVITLSSHNMISSVFSRPYTLDQVSISRRITKSLPIRKSAAVAAPAHRNRRNLSNNLAFNLANNATEAPQQSPQSLAAPPWWWCTLKFAQAQQHDAEKNEQALQVCLQPYPKLQPLKVIKRIPRLLTRCCFNVPQAKYGDCHGHGDNNISKRWSWTSSTKVARGAFWFELLNAMGHSPSSTTPICMWQVHV